MVRSYHLLSGGSGSKTLGWTIDRPLSHLPHFTWPCRCRRRNQYIHSYNCMLLTKDRRSLQIILLWFSLYVITVVRVLRRRRHCRRRHTPHKKNKAKSPSRWQEEVSYGPLRKHRHHADNSVIGESDALLSTWLVLRIVGCPTELSVVPMGGVLEMRRVEERFRDVVRLFDWPVIRPITCRSFIVLSAIEVMSGCCDYHALRLSNNIPLIIVIVV